MSEELVKVLRNAEIKRVGERLTKKELCNIYGFNYNFYMNCVSRRNYPSQKMVEDLSVYLETPTDKVHKMVFASREKEDGFHKNLAISDAEAKELTEKLKNSDILTEPVS